MHIVNEHTLPGLAWSRTVPAVIGFMVVLPFVVLEWANGGFRQGFPFPLFALMWLLVVLFVACATAIIRSLPTGRRGLVLDLGLVSRVAVLFLVAWFWVALVSDQMPCFLGVPNCD